MFSTKLPETNIVLCEGKHKLKYVGLSYRTGPGRGITIYWELNCVHCSYYILVDRRMWAKKILGED